MARIDNIDVPSLLFQEGAAPGTPASTKWRAYFKTDGLYIKDDAGVETGPLGAAGAGSVVSANRTTLTNDTAAALDTYEQWGTETITFTNPGAPAVIDASLAGQFANNAGSATRRIGRARIQISTDGGSTWSDGTLNSVEARGADQRSAYLGPQHLVSATPTGNVVVRVQLYQDTLGTAGDVSFANGVLIARMYV
jgi:hypothetical protein